jgi:glycosidase
MLGNMTHKQIPTIYTIFHKKPDLNWENQNLEEVYEIMRFWLDKS